MSTYSVKNKGIKWPNLRKFFILLIIITVIDDETHEFIQRMHSKCLCNNIIYVLRAYCDLSVLTISLIIFFICSLITFVVYIL